MTFKVHLSLCMRSVSVLNKVVWRYTGMKYYSCLSSYSCEEAVYSDMAVQVLR